MNVNPTRMELKKLKGRLKTAQRGHKLLKDKTDEMIRRFSVLVRETARLRAEVESEVADVLRMFSLARGTMSDKEIELAFSMPVAALSLECVTVNLLNLEIPKLHLQRSQSEESYPYSFAEVTSEADHAVASAGRLVERLLRLAELEKATTMLSDGICDDPRHRGDHSLYFAEAGRKRARQPDASHESKEHARRTGSIVSPIKQSPPRGYEARMRSLRVFLYKKTPTFASRGNSATVAR